MAKLKNRYANALLELSDEKDSLEKDLEQAVFIRDSLRGDDVQSFLKHPHISNKAKEKLFQELFSEKISKHLMGFLYLMVKKSREVLIVPVLDEYIQSANRHFGRVEAKLVSAKALTERQIESIAITLSRKMDKQVEVEAIVDPDVIGGFYILVDGHIFDGTVRSKLNTMRQQLKRGSYE